MQVPRSIHIQGPLAGLAGEVWFDLRSQGYTLLSSLARLRLLNHLSQWLEASGLAGEHLTAARIEAYLLERRRSGHTGFLSWRSIQPIHRVLVRASAVPLAQFDAIPPKATRFDDVLNEYTGYLRRERGLNQATVRNYLLVGSRCFPALCGSDFCPERISADSVIRIVLDESRARPAQRTIVTTGLRSLLRFLHLRGHTACDLSTAVPAIARWRLASLPKFLSPTKAQALLRKCDRRTPVGRRDYAILLLLVRLGLRAGEVSNLDLDDLRWRDGEIVIRGKGSRQDRLPLPADVGDALVCHLRHRRSGAKDRALFLIHCAPHHRLARSGVTSVVRSACRRSNQPVVGAHRLRHTAATDMLRAGASLAEIGQVLRHRHTDTTAIYAKVDRGRLQELARPWVGGGL